MGRMSCDFAQFGIFSAQLTDIIHSTIRAAFPEQQLGQVLRQLLAVNKTGCLARLGEAGSLDMFLWSSLWCLRLFSQEQLYINYTVISSTNDVVTLAN